MKRQVELLSPAGSYDSFISAVNSGADAVYLGGSLFNARGNAANFSNEQLERALYYAHVRGVKIYLTMNTLISNDELEKAVEFTGWAYSKGIDGIIVQDLGFASLVKKHIPEIVLHASTQMTIYNKEGASALKDMGFTRVIPAREITLEEVRDIATNSGLEVEVFIHGALCVSYSGQCLMSSIIGGRSGNRGLCAQPCRLPYRLYKGNQKIKDECHILSTKDLCYLSEIPVLINAGVTSFKIEGRMKSPEYVAVVTSIYRKYINKALEVNVNNKFDIEEDDEKNLLRIFNRGGFTKAYLYEKLGRDLMSQITPKNMGVYLGKVISCNKESGNITLKLEERLIEGDGIEFRSERIKEKGMTVSKLFSQDKRIQIADAGDIVEIAGVRRDLCQKNTEVYKTYDCQLAKDITPKLRSDYEGKKIWISGRVDIRKGEPAKLIIIDSESNTVTVQTEKVAETARVKPLTGEMVLRQIKKTGGTPFEFNDLKVEIEDGAVIPIGELNSLRRKALESLSVMRVNKTTNTRSDIAISFQKTSGKKREKSHVELSISVPGIFSGIEDIPKLVDRIYIPVEEALHHNKRERINSLRNHADIFLRIPPITRGSMYKTVMQVLNDMDNIDGVMLGNIGLVDMVKFRGLKMKMVADYYFNTFNSYAVDELERLGFEKAALSMEMTLEQIKTTSQSSQLGLQALVYGRIPLMTTEYCPIGGVCTKCDAPNTCKDNDYNLTDRFGIKFPVYSNKMNCQSTIYNSRVLFVPELIDRLINMGISELRLDFTDEEPSMIRDIIKLYRYQVGMENKPSFYEELIENIKKAGFTRGHYFKGV